MKGLVTVARSLIFVLLAVLLCGVVFEFAGYSAIDMLAGIAKGAFLRPTSLEQALRWGLPLFITAAGVALAFRCGYFNIGAQGSSTWAPSAPPSPPSG